jgi:hypothetical protein
MFVLVLVGSFALMVGYMLLAEFILDAAALESRRDPRMTRALGAK